VVVLVGDLHQKLSVLVVHMRLAILGRLVVDQRAVRGRLDHADEFVARAGLFLVAGGGEAEGGGDAGVGGRIVVVLHGLNLDLHNLFGGQVGAWCWGHLGLGGRGGGEKDRQGECQEKAKHSEVL